MRRIFVVLFLFLTACSTGYFPDPALPVPSATVTPITPTPSPTASLTPVATATLPPTSTPTPKPLVPDFQHIVMIVFENKEFPRVIGNRSMPVYNQLARDYTLLTQHYAITHPSLPNYLALIGGDTFGITRNCEDCFINAPSLPDLIEASGRTWRTYQEDMPRPCFRGSWGNYAQKHNPFMYFDPIRLNRERCEQHVRPLTDLYLDLEAGALPNFVFITPNLCNSAHDCWLGITDAWLAQQMQSLLTYFSQHTQSFLIILTWDEGDSDAGCCGMKKGGGRIATVLISPYVKNGFEDDTPYTLYSLLKTVSEAWSLPYLGHAADAEHALILKPWK